MPHEGILEEIDFGNKEFSAKTCRMGEEGKELAQLAESIRLKAEEIKESLHFIDPGFKKASGRTFWQKLFSYFS